MNLDNVNHIMLCAVVAELAASGRLNIADANVMVDRIGTGIAGNAADFDCAKSTFADIQRALMHAQRV